MRGKVEGKGKDNYLGGYVRGRRAKCKYGKAGKEEKETRYGRKMMRVYGKEKRVRDKKVVREKPGYEESFKPVKRKHGKFWNITERKG